MSKPEAIISIVAAVADNGVIGNDGALPWRLSSDLKRFKALTVGHPVIMGRKTFESIGKPLPDRLNIIISRDVDWFHEGTMRVSSLGAAIELGIAHLESIWRAAEAEDRPDDEDDDDDLPAEIFVIGGGEVYAQAIGLADVLYVTHVRAEPEGDTHFPAIEPEVWDETWREDVPAGVKDSHATCHVIYERRED